MRNIFNRIINSYDKKVPRSVIFAACFLGIYLKSTSDIVQVIICGVLFIILLAVIVKMIKDGKSLNNILLAIIFEVIDFLIVVFKIMEIKNIDVSKFFIFFIIAFFIIFIAMMIVCYKIALEEGNEARIRQVKLGIVIGSMGAFSFVAVIIMVLLH